jgi:hypothetical protein
MGTPANRKRNRRAPRLRLGGLRAEGRRRRGAGGLRPPAPLGLLPPLRMLAWDRASAGLRRGPLGCAPRTWSRALVGSAPLGSGGFARAAGRLAPACAPEGCVGPGLAASRTRSQGSAGSIPEGGERGEATKHPVLCGRGGYRPRGLRARESSACLICPEPIQRLGSQRKSL